MLLTNEERVCTIKLRSATGGEDMLNSNKIKGRMREMGFVQADIAKRLGLAEPTVSLKINGKRPMDLDEARELAEMLNIDNSEFGSYFFA